MYVASHDQCNIRGFSLLRELSLNLRWSWNHRADIIWEKLNPKLWELTHNPWAVFQAASREKLEELLSDPKFHDLAQQLVETNRREDSQLGWFRQTYKDTPLKCIAYFSLEFMLTEALPIYSGGLGNVAGDLLKAASDLDVPLVGIGLLYQQGYFRQMLDHQGAQQALYPYNDPGQLPITPLRKEDGEWLRLELAFPGYSVWIRTWQAQVGRVKLLLLDSNDLANFPAYRGITSELYGGGPELRLQQELVLGIGGWRLLEALNIEPIVCHLNEGHAAFLALERSFSFMKSRQVDFETALRNTRAGNLFTTHTAVPAGFDRFSPQLIEKNLGLYAKNLIKLPMKNLLALGRSNPEDDSEPFNMAFLAMRGCSFANGVSALHGAVSRRLFAPLFPRWPEEEIPIGHVTNGVHTPSWDSISSDELWSKACGKSRWLQDPQTLGEKIHALPDEELWEMRNNGRLGLIKFTRKNLALQLAVSGVRIEEIELVKHIFNPKALTLGFARRFATYKRPNLLLHDPERLTAILTNSERPVQLIIAGKAHPADLQGQALVKQWATYIKRPEVRPHVAYLSDYNMLLAEQIVQGVDVWINTPLRPWEACGTSGMKVLVNGGLNASVQDGWWAEAYSPDVGWAIGDGEEDLKYAQNNLDRDAADADALYTLLEKEIIPAFYNRNDKGVPFEWIARMRNSMAELTGVYSSNRMLREYAEKYYFSAAELYIRRLNSPDHLTSQQLLEKNWHSLAFGELKVETYDDLHHFSVEVSLNEVDPNFIKVELFSNGNGQNPIVYEMKNTQMVPFKNNIHLYSVEIPTTYPAAYYTPRVRPNYLRLNTTPLEMPQILWQH